MDRHRPSRPSLWNGRISDAQYYLHEKVALINPKTIYSRSFDERTIALLGYACDAGVKRNKGRPGASKGPDMIRKALGKLPNHLLETTTLLDIGNVTCTDGHMEEAQEALSQSVEFLLAQNVLPVVLGGGHDIAYGHFNGIIKGLGANKSVGIINFDAHFDLRDDQDGSHSGTPFLQIAKEASSRNVPFHYLCLGIRPDANDRGLFATAQKYHVKYILNKDLELNHLPNIQKEIDAFLTRVDHVYVTIDLDGFSAAYAPGVSASSPLGFSPSLVFRCLDHIMASKKMLSIDIAELNPSFDIDHRTAKLAASLVHFVIHHSNQL